MRFDIDECDLKTFCTVCNLWFFGKKVSKRQKMTQKLLSCMSEIQKWIRREHILKAFIHREMYKIFKSLLYKQTGRWRDRVRIQRRISLISHQLISQRKFLKKIDTRGCLMITWEYTICNLFYFSKYKNRGKKKESYDRYKIEKPGRKPRS